MKKILFLICFCLMFATTVCANTLSDCYADQALGVISLGVEDTKEFFGLSGKETATTKVSKEVIATIKNRFAIDLENEIEQLGLFIIPTVNEPVTQEYNDNGFKGKMTVAGGPSTEVVIFINGNLNAKSIGNFIKEMVKAGGKEAPKMGSTNVNGKKVATLIANDYRLVLYSSKMLLLCKDSATKLMESNKLTFSKAPISVKELLGRSKSFLYLGKEATGLFAMANLPIEGLETIESVSAYLKNSFLNIEAGFGNESAAKTMLDNVNKYINDYVTQQKKLCDDIKGKFKDIPLVNLPEEISKLYAAAKNIDSANQFKISQKGTSLTTSLPFGGNDTVMLATAGVGVLAAMAIPNFKAARSSARQKACFSNMRVMMGATEMYNMDHQDGMKELNIPELIKDGYLKPVKGPEPECEYYSEGDLTKGGHIACKKHGALQGW